MPDISNLHSTNGNSNYTNISHIFLNKSTRNFNPSQSDVWSALDQVPEVPVIPETQIVTKTQNTYESSSTTINVLLANLRANRDDPRAFKKTLCKELYDDGSDVSMEESGDEDTQLKSDATALSKSQLQSSKNLKSQSKSESDSGPGSKNYNATSTNSKTFKNTSTSIKPQSKPVSKFTQSEAKKFRDLSAKIDELIEKNTESQLARVTTLDRVKEIQQQEVPILVKQRKPPAISRSSVPLKIAKVGLIGNQQQPQQQDQEIQNVDSVEQILRKPHSSTGKTIDIDAIEVVKQEVQKKKKQQQVVNVNENKTKNIQKNHNRNPHVIANNDELSEQDLESDLLQPSTSFQDKEQIFLLETLPVDQHKEIRNLGSSQISESINSQDSSSDEEIAEVQMPSPFKTSSSSRKNNSSDAMAPNHNQIETFPIQMPPRQYNWKKSALAQQEQNQKQSKNDNNDQNLNDSEKNTILADFHSVDIEEVRMQEKLREKREQQLEKLRQSGKRPEVIARYENSKQFGNLNKIYDQHSDSKLDDRDPQTVTQILKSTTRKIETSKLNKSSSKKKSKTNQNHKITGKSSNNNSRNSSIKPTKRLKHHTYTDEARDMIDQKELYQLKQEQEEKELEELQELRSKRAEVESLLEKLKQQEGVGDKTMKEILISDMIVEDVVDQNDDDDDDGEESQTQSDSDSYNKENHDNDHDDIHLNLIGTSVPHPSRLNPSWQITKVLKEKLNEKSTETATMIKMNQNEKQILKEFVDESTIQLGLMPENTSDGKEISGGVNGTTTDHAPQPLHPTYTDKLKTQSQMLKLSVGLQKAPPLKWGTVNVVADQQYQNGNIQNVSVSEITGSAQPIHSQNQIKPFNHLQSTTTSTVHQQQTTTSNCIPSSFSAVHNYGKTLAERRNYLRHQEEVERNKKVNFFTGLRDKIRDMQSDLSVQMGGNTNSSSSLNYQTSSKLEQKGDVDMTTVPLIDEVDNVSKHNYNEDLKQMRFEMLEKQKAALNSIGILEKNQEEQQIHNQHQIQRKPELVDRSVGNSMEFHKMLSVSKIQNPNDQSQQSQQTRNRSQSQDRVQNIHPHDRIRYNNDDVITNTVLSGNLVPQGYLKPIVPPTATQDVDHEQEFDEINFEVTNSNIIIDSRAADIIMSKSPTKSTDVRQLIPQVKGYNTVDAVQDLDSYSDFQNHNNNSGTASDCDTAVAPITINHTEINPWNKSVAKFELNKPEAQPISMNLNVKPDPGKSDTAVESTTSNKLDQKDIFDIDWDPESWTVNAENRSTESQSKPVANKSQLDKQVLNLYGSGTKFLEQEVRDLKVGRRTLQNTNKVLRNLVKDSLQEANKHVIKPGMEIGNLISNGFGKQNILESNTNFDVNCQVDEIEKVKELDLKPKSDLITSYSAVDFSDSAVVSNTDVISKQNLSAATTDVLKHLPTPFQSNRNSNPVDRKPFLHSLQLDTATLMDQQQHHLDLQIQKTEQNSKSIKEKLINDKIRRKSYGVDLRQLERYNANKERVEEEIRIEREEKLKRVEEAREEKMRKVEQLRKESQERRNLLTQRSSQDCDPDQLDYDHIDYMIENPTLRMSVDRVRESRRERSLRRKEERKANQSVNHDDDDDDDDGDLEDLNNENEDESDVILKPKKTQTTDIWAEVDSVPSECEEVIESECDAELNLSQTEMSPTVAAAAIPTLQSEIQDDIQSIIARAKKTLKESQTVVPMVGCNFESALPSKEEYRNLGLSVDDDSRILESGSVVEESYSQARDQVQDQTVQLQEPETIVAEPPQLPTPAQPNLDYKSSQSLNESQASLLNLKLLSLGQENDTVGAATSSGTGTTKTPIHNTTIQDLLENKMDSTTSTATLMSKSPLLAGSSKLVKIESIAQSYENMNINGIHSLMTSSTFGKTLPSTTEMIPIQGEKTMNENTESDIKGDLSKAVSKNLESQVAESYLDSKTQTQQDSMAQITTTSEPEYQIEPASSSSSSASNPSAVSSSSSSSTTALSILSNADKEIKKAEEFRVHCRQQRSLERHHLRNMPSATQNSTAAESMSVNNLLPVIPLLPVGQILSEEITTSVNNNNQNSNGTIGTRGRARTMTFSMQPDSNPNNNNSDTAAQNGIGSLTARNRQLSSSRTPRLPRPPRDLMSLINDSTGHTVQNTNSIDDSIGDPYCPIADNHSNQIQQQKQTVLKSLLHTLNTHTKTNATQSSDTCSICLELMVKGQRITSLRCHEKHCFHVGCLEDWVLSKKSERDGGEGLPKCPLCKETIG